MPVGLTKVHLQAYGTYEVNDAGIGSEPSGAQLVTLS